MLIGIQHWQDSDQENAGLTEDLLETVQIEARELIDRNNDAPVCYGSCLEENDQDSEDQITEHQELTLAPLGAWFSWFLYSETSFFEASILDSSSSFSLSNKVVIKPF